jgi:hypothetical protein
MGRAKKHYIMVLEKRLEYLKKTVAETETPHHYHEAEIGALTWALNICKEWINSRKEMENGREVRSKENS